MSEHAIAAQGPSLDDLTWPASTERLTIRPATPDDADATWRYHRCEPVFRWMTHIATTAGAHRERFTGPERLARTLVVQLAGTVIGDVKLDVDEAPSQVRENARRTQAELGWAFDPEYGGRGYATEAVTELLRIGFGRLGLHRMVAFCFADNEPSWRLMERVGMRRETYMVRDSLHRSGEWLDGMQYALLADEWRHRTGISG